tara:strand:- start:69703 stop:70098 length:396 start_codon:yes stop_codon:yes gene_type:complete
MKFIFALLLVTSYSFADSFDFECVGPDEVYINSFSMQGFTETQDDDLIFDVQFRENGYAGETYERNQVMRKAQHSMITDPITGNNIGLRILSLDKESEMVYINIILNYPGKLTSTIRMKSGRAFKSTCKIL